MWTCGQVFFTHRDGFREWEKREKKGDQLFGWRNDLCNFAKVFQNGTAEGVTSGAGMKFISTPE